MEKLKMTSYYGKSKIWPKNSIENDNFCIYYDFNLNYLLKHSFKRKVISYMLIKSVNLLMTYYGKSKIWPKNSIENDNFCIYYDFNLNICY